jgi:hypothetical protein
VEFFEDTDALSSNVLKEIRHDIAYLSELFSSLMKLICSCKEVGSIILRPNLSCLRLFKVNSIQAQYKPSRAIPIFEPIRARK